MGKATRTREQLRAMVQVRVNTLAEVQRLNAAGARELPIVGLPDPQFPDPRGPQLGHHAAAERVQP